MGKSIICGVDGSADSQAALKVAAEFAGRLGSTLILAYVAEPAYVPHAATYPFGGVDGPMTMTKKTESAEEEGARLLQWLASNAGLVDADRRVAIGHPAERLADLADEEDADLIVVGSRGRGSLKAAFLGSVSNSLIGIARCPVLVVPRGAAETAAAP